MSKDALCPKCGHVMWNHRVLDDVQRHQCWERLSYDNNDFCGCDHGAPPIPTLTLYAVQNAETKHWFQAKGRDGWNKKTWDPDITKAKMYPKLAQARGRVTYFSNNWPQLEPPVIVEFQAKQVRVLREAGRLEIAKQKREQEEQKARERDHVLALQDAEEELKEAQERLRKLKDEG